MRDTERGRDTGRERSRLHADSPMWDSILGLQDHDLSQRQVLNHCATQASLFFFFQNGFLRVLISSFMSLIILNLLYSLSDSEPLFPEVLGTFISTTSWLR